MLAHQDSVCGQSWGGAAVGGLGQRTQAAAAAGSSAPARSWPVPSNKRLRRLEWILGEKLGVIGGAGSEWERELGGDGFNGAR